jgi:hypothetical protein
MLRIYPWLPSEQFNEKNTTESPNFAALMEPSKKNVASIFSAENSIEHPLPDCAEISAHSGAIVGIFESADGKRVTSLGCDGSIIIYDVKRFSSTGDIGTSNVNFEDMINLQDSSLPEDLKEGFDSAPYYNDDVVMLSSEDMDEHVNDVIELQKRLAEVTSKFNFEVHTMQLNYADETRKALESHDKDLNCEKDKYELLQHEFDAKLKEMTEIINKKDIDHIKVTSEIENRYEHKLATQLDRYDRLAEDMEQLKQRCDALLIMERQDFEKEITELVQKSKANEYRLKNDRKRILDEKGTEENAFKEILDQQENDYEDELRHLIVSAESELKTERDTISRLRAVVHSKVSQFIVPRLGRLK